MGNRDTRKQLAEETLHILEKGFWLTPSGEEIDFGQTQQKAVENTIVYTPQLSDELLKNQSVDSTGATTAYSVVSQTTLDAVRGLIAEGYEDVFCLNFASAKNPGGGFLGGSQAQEESIARATGLYPCQMKAWEYYEVNRNTKSCIYTDYMIYSPKVPIIKNEAGRNHTELKTCSILTAPAVNAGVVKQREPDRVGEIEEVMKRRIRKVLAIALKHQHKALVLGAWGCGVFQNNPNEIAQYFHEVLSEEFKGQFEKVVFAVYAKNERFIKPFQELFA